MVLSGLWKTIAKQERTQSLIAAVIRDEIAARGPISIERFMQIALHHPGHGYYRKGDFLSGDNADFATAPEISQLFGEMIAVWLLDAWSKAGKPTAFALLELGPGRGTMMLDIMHSLQNEEMFRSGARLYLMESNETLRALQGERLSAFAPTHIDAFDALPDLPLFCVSNEFFDTQPLRQFERAPRGWHERLVGVNGSSFAFYEGPETPLLPVEADTVADSFATGAVYEITDIGRTYAKQMAGHIARFGGAALVIDYGYDRPRGKNTLIAVRAKQFHEDIFKLPGQADITADVDFSALSAIGRTFGLTVSGPIGQGDFLRLMGINERAKSLCQKASFFTKRKIGKDIRRLTHDREMGFAFRVLSYSGNGRGV